LLLSVANDSTDDGVLLSGQAIQGPFRVTFDLSGIILGFTSGVLFLARFLPGSRTSHVADSLDDGAFDGVKLARSFARTINEPHSRKIRTSAYLGWPELMLSAGAEEDILIYICIWV
jgi:hypothetical protein